MDEDKRNLLQAFALMLCGGKFIWDAFNQYLQDELINENIKQIRDLEKRENLREPLQNKLINQNRKLIVSENQWMTQRESSQNKLITENRNYVMKKSKEKRTREFMLKKVYHELPKHIHFAKTTGDVLIDKRFEPKSQIGSGIILKGHYLTMEHIINAICTKPNQTPSGIFPPLKEMYKIKNRKVVLNGKTLEKKILSVRNDVAIFKLPYNLNFPDFPCEPSNDIKLGDEIYIIGTPKLSCKNIRSGKISDLNNSYMPYKIEDNRNCFGISIPVINGDSGTPVVKLTKSGLKLVGLVVNCLGSKLGYVKKIKEFTKYLN